MLIVKECGDIAGNRIASVIVIQRLEMIECNRLLVGLSAIPLSPRNHRNNPHTSPSRFTQLMNRQEITLSDTQIIASGILKKTCQTIFSMKN